MTKTVAFPIAPSRVRLRSALQFLPGWMQHIAFTGLWALIWCLLIAAPILAYAGWLQLTGNIDTVDEGRLYRSATLSPATLKSLIEKDHIATVINLRGASPGQSWYDREREVTAAAHVTQIDLPFSAIREPNPELLGKLLVALRTAPTPILIHCSSGSDRTGLAAALYKFDVLGQPAAVAQGELSFYWGHFPWLGSPTIAMDRTFERYVAGKAPPAGPGGAN